MSILETSRATVRERSYKIEEQINVRRMEHVRNYGQHVKFEYNSDTPSPNLERSFCSLVDGIPLLILQKCKLLVIFFLETKK